MSKDVKLQNAIKSITNSNIYYASAGLYRMQIGTEPFGSPVGPDELIVRKYEKKKRLYNYGRKARERATTTKIKTGTDGEIDGFNIEGDLDNNDTEFQGEINNDNDNDEVDENNNDDNKDEEFMAFKPDNIPVNLKRPLPDSSLLMSLQNYTSNYYDMKYKPELNKELCHAFDETALIALGVVIEEAIKQSIDDDDYKLYEERSNLT